MSGALVEVAFQLGLFRSERGTLESQQTHPLHLDDGLGSAFQNANTPKIAVHQELFCRGTRAVDPADQLVAAQGSRSREEALFQAIEIFGLRSHEPIIHGSRNLDSDPHIPL